jgi:hypothetical protein
VKRGDSRPHQLGGSLQGSPRERARRDGRMGAGKQEPMKRIGLIGVAVTLLMFGNVAGMFAQNDQKQEDQNKERGKSGKQPKDDKAKGKEKKENKGKDNGKSGPPPVQAQQQQPVQQQQAERQRQAAQQQQEAQQQQALRNRQAAQQQALRNQQAARQMQAQQQQQTARNQEAQRLSQQEQQQRIAEQQQRTSAYQNALNQQLRIAQQQNLQLQQNRRSQFEVQQQYAERLRQQESQAQNDRNYNFGNDAFFNTPWNYRYEVGNVYRQTNQYGAHSLQEAVNYGYQEGFLAGDADRRDRWGYKYQDSFAYRDANFGYRGLYVAQSDYNYYFRLGFRKGYDDGYYSRSRYGRRGNGSYTVLKVVLSGILKLEVIR